MELNAVPLASLVMRELAEAQGDGNRSLSAISSNSTLISSALGSATSGKLILISETSWTSGSFC